MLPSKCQQLAFQRSLTAGSTCLPICARTCNNWRQQQLHYLGQTIICNRTQLHTHLGCTRLLLTSSAKNNENHPYARLNQICNDDGKTNNQSKNTTTQSNDVHPYKRLVQTTIASSGNSSSMSSTSKKTHPYTRFNQSTTIKNDYVHPYKRLNEKRLNDSNHGMPSSSILQSSSVNNKNTVVKKNVDHNQHLYPISSDSKPIDYTKLLSKCTLISERLIQKQSSLSSPPISWLYSHHSYHKNKNIKQPLNQTEYKERFLQYQEFHKLLSIILAESFLKQMDMLISSPSQNVQTLHSLNMLFTNCLIVCSNSLPSKYWSEILKNENDKNNRDGNVISHLDQNATKTPIQTSIEIYDLLHRYNLDIQPIHYECIIKTANFDSDDNDKDGRNKYELASKVFKKQINIDQSGYLPIDSRLSWDKSVEMGLYSIIMNEIHKSRNDDDNGMDFVTENIGREVMDAVDEMCMVSSADQERYILAAGSAMGRTGQYLAIPHYIRNNGEKSSKFGHALIAAAMHACVQCEQYELALQLYHDLATDPSSSEWQWAGSYGTVHPLCRDLAIQCMGHLRQKGIPEYSESATKILHEIIEDDGVVSQKALISLFRIFESKGDVEKAIKLGNLMLSYREGRTNWKVVGESLENFIVGSSFRDELEADAYGVSDESLLTLVMDTCNVAGEYGLAILFSRLGLEQHHMSSNRNDFEELAGESICSLLDSQPLLSKNDEILAATMYALCGLGCQGDAISLYNKVMDITQKNTDNWDMATECMEYAHSLRKKQNEKWKQTYHYMDRVIFEIQCARDLKKPLSQDELLQFQSAVVKMLHTSTKAGQPKAGLYLAKVAAAVAARSQQAPTTSIKRVFQAFFGYKDEKKSHLSSSNPSWNTFLSSSDDILSTTMQAYKAIGEQDEALLLFFNKWEKDSKMRKSIRSLPFHPDPNHPDRKWIKSCNAAIETLLIQRRFEQANTFFEAILPSYRTAETYCIMARVYACENNWEEIGKLFDDARNLNHLSDELAILAMKGIVSKQIDGKMRILRAIVDEVASSQQVKAGEWIFQNYWDIKKHLGFHYARLLMWWNDPSKTQEEELRIALQHFTNRANVNLDALECIIDLAGYKHLELYGKESISDEALISQKSVADTIINSILNTIDRNGEGNLLPYVSKAMKALGKIGAKKACVDLGIALIEKGHESLLSNTSIVIARNMAKESGDEASLHRIEGILHS